MKWKWSQFSFWIKSDDGKTIIMRNTLTASTVRVSVGLKKMIDSIIHNEEAIKSVPQYVKEYIKRLADLGLLVPSDLDEGKKYLEIFQKNRADDKTFAVYLVTTENCQFKCPYCFERNISQRGSMTRKTARKVAEWVKEYINNHEDCDKLRIVLYGGEPLLNKSIIRYILPVLYNIAVDRGLEFEHGILTNGELLDIKTLEFLNRFNLDRVQITLDGPKEMHDVRRVRKDGTGTFDKIMKNILDGFSRNLLREINLRVNFDRQNVRFIPQLFNVLASHSLQRRIKLSFGIITPTIFYDDTRRKTQDPYFGEFGLDQRENAENYLWLCEEAKKRGFEIPKEYLMGPWCVARKIHSAVIDYDGSLFKCISLVGRKEFSFGDIYSTKDTNDSKFNDFSYLEDCLSKRCPFVPICGGNCRFQSYVELGRFNKPYCQKELIEGINKGLLKLNFNQ